MSLLTRQSKKNRFRYETVEEFDDTREEVPHSSTEYVTAIQMLSALTYLSRCNSYTTIWFCRSIDDVQFGI